MSVLKILLLGEFSGLHANLAKGLKNMGHQVVVVSNGDGWKDYPRDINLYFPGKYRKLRLLIAILKSLPKLVSYDVVQFVNPNFLDATPLPNRLIFEYVKMFNKNIFLGANGNDYYYINCGLNGGYKKSIFNFNHLLKEDYMERYIKVPLSKFYKKYNQKLARTAKGITACCAEYEIAYKEYFKEKTTFIPLPIDTSKNDFCNSIHGNAEKVVFFMGHYKDRRVLKGTDVMEEVLVELKKRHPEKVEIHIVDSIPYEEYQYLLNNAHVLVDQLYSYGYGMNGVLGLSKGLIVAGGADDYLYEIMNEQKNKPLVYLPIDKQEMLHVLELLITDKDGLTERAKNSRQFALEHHDYRIVAQRYLQFWELKI